MGPKGHPEETIDPDVEPPDSVHAASPRHNHVVAKSMLYVLGLVDSYAWSPLPPIFPTLNGVLRRFALRTSSAVEHIEWSSLRTTLVYSNTTHPPTIYQVDKPCVPPPGGKPR